MAVVRANDIFRFPASLEIGQHLVAECLELLGVFEGHIIPAKTVVGSVRLDDVTPCGFEGDPFLRPDLCEKPGWFIPAI